MQLPVFVHLAAHSLASRRTAAALTAASIAVSVALVLAVEHIRVETRSSFANTISGADLIVGARGGPLNLLLYAVFRIGDPTANISWDSYTMLAARPEVAWTVPLSLGDSYRGYRVLGTDSGYFEHYRYGRRLPLALADGAVFDHADEAVIGAEVARRLKHVVGDRIVLAHGLGASSFVSHYTLPFTVVGVLRPTGTPVDRTVHIPLAGLQAIHAHPGAPQAAPDQPPRAITAAIVGLDSPVAVLRIQRLVNTWRAEPLQAVVPGVALQQLFALLAVAENALLAVSVCVVLAGLVGLVTTLLAGIAWRRHEMAVLRAVGASPGVLFALLVSEAALLALAGGVTGVLLAHAALAAARSQAGNLFGLHLAAGTPGVFDLAVVAAVTCAAALAATLPAWRVYRHTLADGLAPRA